MTTTRASAGISHSWALGGLLLFGVLGAAAAYAWHARSAARLDGMQEPLVIAANTEYVGTCPITIANERGYFREEGISATVQQYNSGKASLQAALDGKADLATTADIPVMLAAMSDIPVAVIATFFKTEHDHGIVGRRDRGIGTPASLKGKRIGVTIGTSGHFVLDAFLNRQRLSAADVSLLNLRPDQFAGAMARGEIDAVAGWEPFLGKLLADLGENGVVFYGEEIYEIPYNLAGRREYVERHPALMKKALRAVAKGVQFCRAEPEAARTIMGRVLKVDTEAWKANWPSYRFKLALDQGLILALEDESRWAMANKLVPARATPNYLNYIYLDALISVAPTAVGVIH
ncbi:MAG: NrtA/SsuA/CpmA family ABC transporter substrate-binding protein [Pseudomonadota bacterium]